MIVKISGYPPILLSSLAAFTQGDGAQVTTITAVADVAGSLNNKYFFLPSANNDIIYLVWIDVDGGGTAPFITNTTNVQVAISADDTNATVGGVLRTAIDALPAFGTGGANETCTITYASNGRAVLAHDDPENPSTLTGFTFTDTTPGLNAIPNNLFYRVQGKIMKDSVHYDSSVSGTLSQVRFASESIDIIVPFLRIQELVTY